MLLRKKHPAKKQIHVWFYWPSRVFATVLALLVGLAVQTESTQRTILANETSVDSGEFFSRVVRPILTEKCLACHGPDDAARESGLRFDRRQVAVDSGAIVEGKPEESEMIMRILSDDPDLVMPPPETGNAITDSELASLRTWIKNGADYVEHWSFVPSVAKVLPPSNDWSPHPIDRFVFQRLAKVGLSPNEEALPWELLRRVSLDLTGLPPTDAMTRAFLENPSEDTYEQLVNDLLDQKSFGEHWARMWLDLARYADTKGYEKDRERTIWRYRDWVINAFNQDMPYDQFTIEQLAGDLLPNATMDQRLATAFHRNTMENDEGGTDDEEFRVAAVKDRVDTTMQIWMGLTAGCAKCHSHKYDPISQKDYYQLYAFFNQTADADRGQPVLPTPTGGQQAELDRLQGELASLQADYRKADKKSDVEFDQWQQQFSDQKIWNPFKITSLVSQAGVTLREVGVGDYDVDGELPEKDTWVITIEIPDGVSIRAIRLDTLPKPDGGKWPDKNVALREISAELIDASGVANPVNLVRPRADFSQRGWEVERAIDGKPDAGWAFSPQASKPHCAVFDLEEPIEAGSGLGLRLTLEQQYGQGLTLDRFKFSYSDYPSQWLAPDVNPSSNLREIYRREIDPRTKAIAEDIAAKREEVQVLRRSIPTTPVMEELAEDRKRETKIHQRGNFLDPGEIVTAAVPDQFGKFPSESPVNRLGLAHWLLSDSNPLTARVAVNRFWARLFGRGLVETEEDFGTQGAMPTHPELLDWLAGEFRADGWSVKQLLKTIVMSKTYRQSSRFTEHNLTVDPRNDFLSRGSRFRLSAETVRDQSLAVSGLLTERVGGASVMPPQPDGIWKSTYSGEQWKNATGEDRYRRAIYTYKKRTSPYPAMTTFDSGSGEVCQIRRIRTNTPLQALVTLNDVAFFEAAGGLAKRMENASEELRGRIENGFRMTLVRDGSKQELDRLVDLYQTLDFDDVQEREILESAGLKEGDAKLVMLANVLLNLDETLTKP